MRFSSGGARLPSIVAKASGLRILSERKPERCATLTGRTKNPSVIARAHNPLKPFTKSNSPRTRRGDQQDSGCELAQLWRKLRDIRNDSEMSLATEQWRATVP
jgi:hypothetical protein